MVYLLKSLHRPGRAVYVILKNKESLATYTVRRQRKSVQVAKTKEVFQLTLGDFLSVFLLTRTGLSYFTREAFGGIMLAILTLSFSDKYLQQTTL